MKTNLLILKSRYIILNILILFLIAGCQKGDTGPAGSTGPQGPAGATGAAGATGTSNIQTFTFTANPTDWYATSGDSNNPAQWVYSASIPALTNAILSTGAILVYKYNPASSSEILLPFTQNGIDFGYLSGLLTPANSGVPSTTGVVQIYVTKSGPYLNLNPSATSPIYFKVVLIAP